MNTPDEIMSGRSARPQAFIQRFAADFWDRGVSYDTQFDKLAHAIMDGWGPGKKVSAQAIFAAMCGQSIKEMLQLNEIELKTLMQHNPEVCFAVALYDWAIVERYDEIADDYMLVIRQHIGAKTALPSYWELPEYAEHVV